MLMVSIPLFVIVLMNTVMEKLASVKLVSRQRSIYDCAWKRFFLTNDISCMN